MSKLLNEDIKDLLSELVGDYVQPSIQDFPFSSPDEVAEALKYLADEIESLDPHEIFGNLTVDAPEVLPETFEEAEE